MFPIHILTRISLITCRELFVVWFDLVFQIPYVFRFRFKMYFR